MAIRKTITLRNGLTAIDAYIRVDAFAGSKAGVLYSANLYLSEEAYRGSAAMPSQGYLEQDQFEFVPDSAADAPHVWQQCYAHLLAQDRYVDADPA